MGLENEIGRLLVQMRRNPLGPAGERRSELPLSALGEALGRNENTLRMWERLAEPSSNPASVRTPSPAMVARWAEVCGYRVQVSAAPRSAASSDASPPSPALQAVIAELAEVDCAPGGGAELEALLRLVRAWAVSRA